MNGENVTKVYVDSPIFSREDEERFRYINPNVDDDEDDDENFRFMSRDSLVGLKRDREHDEHRPRNASNDAGRYESVEHVSNRGFVLHSKPPAVEERKRTRQMPADYNPRRSDPMSRELNEEVEEERIEMEQRNQNQRRKARQNNIPQLDLIDSEDEERSRRGRGFTDLEIDEGRCFDSEETVAEQLWAAKQRDILAAKGQRIGSTEGKTEAHQKSHFAAVKPASSSSQHQQALPPIAHQQQYYNPDDQVQRQVLFQPVGMPSDEQTAAPRGFLPFRPYTIDGSEDPGQGIVARPPRQTESGRPANQNRVVSHQRRVGSESNITRTMPQPQTDKDYIRANRRDVIRKEKPKKSYGEMFSDRRRKENVDAGPTQRWRSEEARVRHPMSENHGYPNVPREFVGPPPASITQPPAAMGHIPVAMTQPPVGMAQHSALPVAYPSYVSPAQPVPINADPMSLPYAAHPVSLTYHQPPVGLTQQPSHQFHGGYPFQQVPVAAAPVEHQQRISIPLQFQGNLTAADQQKVSVDINLRLLNAESENHQTQPPFSPSKINHQHLQTNGNPIPSYSGQSQTMSNDAGISVVNGQLTNRPHATKTMSHYNILPPVGSADMKKATLGGRPLRNSGGNAVKNGYAEQQRKQKQLPQYKEYTLNDYRRMKKEVKTLNLGKLGPDLENEERVEKQLKEKRKQMYSKQVKQRNRTELARSRRDSASEDSVRDEESVTRRKLALEYAKTIPKPKTFARGDKENLASKESSLKADSDTELFLDEYEELRLLKERHEMERKQLELIERGVKTILAQNA